jgi:hypothetical protein
MNRERRLTVSHRSWWARGWDRALRPSKRRLPLFLDLRLVAAVALVVAVQSAAFAACGGTERWFVKVGTDPDAGLVQLNPVMPITVSGLNTLPKRQNTVPHGDNQFRLPEERVVYQVSGRLALFKDEDDGDYHLVITDDSLTYTPGGPGTNGLETGTSFIAEIPDPACVPGKKGDPNTPSRFDTQLRDVRAKFEARFPGGAGADTDLGGIPVTIVGIAFYDRPHLQTGRAINGIELHPLLDIQFGAAAPPVVPSPPPGPVVTQLLANPDFELGVSGWHGTLGDIGAFPGETGRSGQKFAWMGGLATAHSESLYQNVSIPASAQSVTLSLWLNIATDETTTANAYDRLYVQIRNQNGAVLKTLATYSNLDATPGYVQKTFDVSIFRGQTVQVFFRMVEDNGKATSFRLDDVTLTIQ